MAVLNIVLGLGSELRHKGGGKCGNAEGRGSLEQEDKPVVKSTHHLAVEEAMNP